MPQVVQPSLSTTKNYVGYSYNDKPTYVAQGSRFFELDTGLVYVFNGSAWLLAGPLQPDAAGKRLDRIADLLEQILAELQRLK